MGGTELLPRGVGYVATAAADGKGQGWCFAAGRQRFLLKFQTARRADWSGRQTRAAEYRAIMFSECLSAIDPAWIVGNPPGSPPVPPGFIRVDGIGEPLWRGRRIEEPPALHRLTPCTDLHKSAQPRQLTQTLAMAYWRNG